MWAAAKFAIVVAAGAGIVCRSLPVVPLFG
jgi:hypothetical protein